MFERSRFFNVINPNFIKSLKGSNLCAKSEMRFCDNKVDIFNTIYFCQWKHFPHFLQPFLKISFVNNLRLEQFLPNHNSVHHFSANCTCISDIMLVQVPRVEYLTGPACEYSVTNNPNNLWKKVEKPLPSLFGELFKNLSCPLLGGGGRGGGGKSGRASLGTKLLNNTKRCHL